MSCAIHAEVEEGLRTCARCGREFCADCTIVVRGRVICAECKEDEVRDRLSGVGTESPLADVRLRIVAWLIDYLIFFVINFGLRWIRLPAQLFISAGVTWAGFVVYEALMLSVAGQTVGKMAARIKVVRADGAALGPGPAWLRAFIRGLFPSIAAVIDYFPAAVTMERTCIHDLVARTRVVKLDGAR